MKLMQIERLTDDVKKAEHSKSSEATRNSELAAIKTKSELTYTVFVGAVAAVITTVIATLIKYFVGM